jgi:dienelactone hydrolase
MRFEEELRSFEKDFESYNYVNAKHAFMNEKKERFHEPSASQAFKRVIEFLKK